MLYTFLISIAFIGELILLFTAVRGLLKLDKMILKLNETITESKPEIKDISTLAKKISGQWVVLADDWADDIHKKSEDTVINNLNKILLAVLLWKINSKRIKKFRRSKLGKAIKRGFAFVQNMV